MINVLIGIAIIGVVIVAGFLIARFRVLPTGSREVLNRTAFFIATPALLFTVIAREPIELLFSTQLVIVVLTFVAMAAVYLVVSRIFFRQPAAETIIGMLASGQLNSNNMGLPVAIYVLGGPQWVAPALLFQLVLLVPVALTALDLTALGRPSVTRILLGPVTNPIIIGSLLGALVSATGVQLPDAVYAPFELVGGAAIPMILLAFGMSLTEQRPLQAGTGRRAIVTAAALKSIVMPISAWLLGRFVFGLEGQALYAAVIVAALPTAQNVYNFAVRYGRGEVLARDTVLLTTVVCVPVLLLIAALLAP